VSTTLLARFSVAHTCCRRCLQDTLAETERQSALAVGAAKEELASFQAAMQGFGDELLDSFETTSTSATHTSGCVRVPTLCTTSSTEFLILLSCFGSWHRYRATWPRS
jgi:hypothetical protein